MFCFFPALLLWFRHFEGSAHSVSHTLMLWGHQGHVSCLPKQHGSDSGCSPVNHSEVSCFQQKKNRTCRAEQKGNAADQRLSLRISRQGLGKEKLVVAIFS